MLSRTEVFHGERTSEARTSGSGTRAVYWSSRENRTAVEIKTKVQSTLSLYAKPEVGLWDERNFFASVFASPHLRGQSSLLSGDSAALHGPWSMNSAQVRRAQRSLS